MCYTYTTYLLHFLLGQDTLCPPEQSAQPGCRKEAGNTQRPHPGQSFPGRGRGTFLDPGLSFLWFSVGVIPPALRGAVRIDEDPGDGADTAMAQPRLRRVNFPAGKRNREWDPSEDRCQGSNVPGGQVPTAPPCCLYICNIHAEY